MFKQLEDKSYGEQEVIKKKWTAQQKDLYERYQAYQKKQQEEYAAKRKKELGHCEPDEMCVGHCDHSMPFISPSSLIVSVNSAVST
jgi:hypothetical protein